MKVKKKKKVREAGTALSILYPMAKITTTSNKVVELASPNLFSGQYGLLRIKCAAGDETTMKYFCVNAALSCPHFRVNKIVVERLVMIPTKENF